MPKQKELEDRQTCDNEENGFDNFCKDDISADLNLLIQESR